MLTESQARFVLRRMGYRLSQYNEGYRILDADHNYVDAEGGHAAGEMTLQQIADWISAKSGSGQSSVPTEEPPANP